MAGTNIRIWGGGRFWVPQNPALTHTWAAQQVTTMAHTIDLSGYGISDAAEIIHNPSYELLFAEETRKDLQGYEKGIVTESGAVAVHTGIFTGRSPKDKFIVLDDISKQHIWWNSPESPNDNKPISPANWAVLKGLVTQRLSGQRLFVVDTFCGANENSRLKVRFVMEVAWQAHFVKNMFIRPTEAELSSYGEPDFVVLNASKTSDPDWQSHGLNSEVFTVFNMTEKMQIIAGTWYGGEMKKGMFAMMNYYLPLKNMASMHCSANVGEEGDTAIFFGLSGTGKTTLSADPNRKLIGDDEHGWSEDGVFNFEGGCYAKAIRLSKDAEPFIYDCTRKFGTVLENVIMDPATRRLDLNDNSLTENTRAAYPLTHIPNSVPERRGGHPKNVIMLTCDAYGIMPPVAKLTPEQAMYHFISGYTAKVAGTERGMSREPTAVFSTCFGAPFMALHPSVYANLLGEKIAANDVNCWLVNTGWTGGPYGVGTRMEIAHTRAMIKAILDGTLSGVNTWADPVFGLAVPEECPDVPPEVLNPRNTWKRPEDYDEKARDLANQFIENFKQYEEGTSAEIKAAGPQVQPAKVANLQQIKK